jgi:hypothetical protein
MEGVGILYVLWVYFKAIWYILWPYGIFCSYLEFLPVLVCCNKKKLAILELSKLEAECPNKNRRCKARQVN